MIVLGIIPARGGSKTVPLKNIKTLNGKPLIAYSIESANQARSVSRLVVSTENSKIAQIVSECETEVIIRPTEYAIDQAPTEFALLHVLDKLKEEEGFDPDIVLTLEPTSPFRTHGLIDQCINIFSNTDADSVISVVETCSCYGKIVDGRFEFLFPGQSRRRQDREPLYRESSTIYATRTKVLRRKFSVLGDRLYPLNVPVWEALDINTQSDFEMAEALMNVKISQRREEVW